MKTNSPSQTKGVLSAIAQLLPGFIAVLFWGLSFVSTSKLLINKETETGYLTPTEAYIYRFAFAYLLIFIFMSHKRLFCSNWRDELLLVLCGMSSGSIYFIAENTALTMTASANVSLLSATSPLVTILIVGLIYKSERPGSGIIIGSLIAFVGVCCVICNSFISNGEEFHFSPLGDLVAFSTAFSWAIYSLLLRRINPVYDAMFITRKTFFYGIVTALPFLLMQDHLTSPVIIFTTPIVLGNMLFLVLCSSILSFYLWTRTVDTIGAVKANNYMYLQPVITLIGAAILIGEKITILGVIGLVIVLFGLWFGSYLQKRNELRTPGE